MMEIENNEMEKLYAESFRQFRDGDILTGTIVSAKQDGVLVDIGYKSEGFIAGEEFSVEELSRLREGDKIEVYVTGTRSPGGAINLSKEKALKLKIWDLLEEALNKGSQIKGCITEKISSGLSVDIMGIKAFMPSSQTDRSLKDSDDIIGKTVDLKVLKLDNRHLNVVVSSRAAMEENRLKKKLEILPLLKEGALLQGIVKNITDYGVFVDLDGIDGLLHISDISWGRITHPSEFFAIGDRIEVMVLKYDEALGKIALGYKQKTPDPWLSVEDKYGIGKKVTGNVVSITDYGAFIELEGGVEGLVHVSEIDWAPRSKSPSKHLSIGETVEAVVLKVDTKGRRISLSMKQLTPSPWELVSQKYAVGQVITGKVKGLTEFGAFVGLPEGVDGLIHISDISWTKHIKHPSEALKKGQDIEAVILSIDPEKERIALGLKQRLPNPWLEEIPEKFKLGDKVRCVILKMADFGVFVELEGNVEGLIHSSEIVRGEDEIKPGDEIWARIIKVDVNERKIGLSMKQV